MAISFKQRVCETCGGDLVLDQARGCYVCMYCGNTYERSESYDGNLSVRNAALQALNSVASLGGSLDKWDTVEDNLNDCLKIDPSYAGTIVAQLAAAFTRVRVLGRTDPNAAKAELSKVSGAYAKLGKGFDPSTHGDEADFYDAIESADARTLLAGVFTAFHDDARASYLENGIHSSDLHSSEAAMMLITRAFEQKDWDKLDDTLTSPAVIDANAVFARLLTEYPDREGKAQDAELLLGKGVDAQAAREAASAYLRSSDDAPDTKVAVLQRCTAHGVAPTGEAMAKLLGEAGPEACSTIFEKLPGGVLTDGDVSQLTRALQANEPVDVMGTCLAALAAAGYFVDLRADDALAFMERTDLPVADRVSGWKTLCDAGLEPRRRQSVFDDILLKLPAANAAKSAADAPANVAVTADAEAPADAETPKDAAPADAAATGANDPTAAKPTLLAAIAATLPDGPSPFTVRTYLGESTIDGTAKPQVLASFLDMLGSAPVIRTAASDYEHTHPDDSDTALAVLRVLAEAGVIDSIGGSMGSAGFQAVGSGVQASPHALDEYLTLTLKPNASEPFNPTTAQGLVVPGLQVSPGNAMSFLFATPDFPGKGDMFAHMLHGTVLDADAPVQVYTQPTGALLIAPLLQCYLLASTDGPDTAQSVIAALQPVTSQLNCDVTFAGTPTRFRKLVRSGQVTVPQSTAAFCEGIGMFQ